MTHAELVERAAYWLFWSQQCGVVITDIVTACSETPDAIGWASRGSILVECKTSRADFYAEKWKRHRRLPETGVGGLRYYMAPKGVLKAEDMPLSWGLIEPAGERIRYISRAAKQPCNCEAETIMLVSAMRRLGCHEPPGVQCHIYTPLSESCRKTTIGIWPEGTEPAGGVQPLKEGEVEPCKS